MLGSSLVFFLTKSVGTNTLQDMRYIEQDLKQEGMQVDELSPEVMRRIDRKLSHKALDAAAVTTSLTYELFPEAGVLFEMALQMQALSIQLRNFEGTSRPKEYWDLLEGFETLAGKFNKVSSLYVCYRSISLPHIASQAPRPEFTALGDDDIEKGACELAFSFVETLLDLLASDRVGLIRRCEYCGDWFYADRMAQKFCYEGCRKGAFESRTDVRERRNEARRLRYQASKEAEKAYFRRNCAVPYRRRK